MQIEYLILQTYVEPFSNIGANARTVDEVLGFLVKLDAIVHFVLDTDRGVEFSTYATPTVIGEIKRHTPVIADPFHWRAQ